MLLKSKEDWWETESAFHMTFEKPHLDGRFYIRASRLKQVKEKGKKLIIEFAGKKYIFTYKQFMDGAKFWAKPMLIENYPMKLWGQVLSKGAEFDPKKHDQVIVENVLDKAFNGFTEAQKAFLQAKLHQS